MRSRALAVGILVVLLLLGGGVAAAVAPPALTTAGPTHVSGTPETAVFTLGDKRIRQVRYVDRGTLVYHFALVNDGRLPVRISGIVPPQPEPHLFRYLRLTDGSGDTDFTVGGGESRAVQLFLRMTDCETLSARAGSFVTEVTLRAGYAPGWRGHDVTVAFPELVRTGSPREAGCANATASSRPPG